MDLPQGSTFSIIITIGVLLLSAPLIMRRLRSSLVPVAGTGKLSSSDEMIDLARHSSPEAVQLSQTLARAVPGRVILPRDESVGGFKKSMNVYWAQQECEVVPACVVRPVSVEELSTVVKLLKEEYDKTIRQEGRAKAHAMFAVRSGGHSPVHGAASVKGGVLVDMSGFNEVTPSEDGLTVVLGSGARWMDVSKALDAKGLAVAGGRNSAVGVGGLTLGGGLSFFSPQCGLVCSNIISYEVVLASGEIVTASESSYPDLWQALKGGSNNFGIVTRFTARSFSSGKVWSGMLYMPSFQASKVITGFHDYVKRADASDSTTSFDPHAAGPICSFSYVQQLGMQLVAVNLVYTKELENGQKWPECWKTSAFPSLFRLWNTCKNRSLTSATDELNALNPNGRRQILAATTITNHHATLIAAHAAYVEALTPLRKANVTGLVFTFIFQPLIPEWLRKGQPNPLGLHDGTDEPLVLASFAINWDEHGHDDVVKSITKATLDKIEAVAKANNASHRWKYLNYCAEWQKPFESYGEENWRFLRNMSRKYDPDGLFQRGCIGGFKLGLVDGEE